MRKFLALVVALAAVTAACSGPAAVTGDPYELIQRSQSATWDRVQIDIGITVSGPDAFSIDPSAIRLAFDTQSGKVNAHLALPMSALGDAASELRAFVTGDTLELDLIFDGQALYAKSPLGSTIGLLMLQSGEIPPGDMTGWLRLLSKDDLDSLGELAGGGSVVPVPNDLPIPSAADAASLKATLDEMGITLTHAGTASRNGVDAEKVTAAIDLEKFAQSEYFRNLGAAGADLEADAGSLSIDLWFDHGNSRLIGIDLHAASADDPNEKADVTINLHEPDAGVSFDAPSPFVEVPLLDLIDTFMESFGGLM